MYDKTFAPTLSGFNGDGSYHYEIALIGNPNVEPEVEYFILRLRAKGDTQEISVRQEIASLYSWGYYSYEEKESGLLRIEDGKICEVSLYSTSICDGSVPVIFWNPQQTSRGAQLVDLLERGKAGQEPEVRPREKIEG